MHTPRSSAIRNEPYLPLPSQPKLVLIYRPRRDGRLSWAWVAGWLHTEINVRHRELNPDTVTHLSTNRARRWLTSLIEANALTTTPDHQPILWWSAKLQQQAAHCHSLTQELLGHCMSVEAARLIRPVTSLLAVLRLTAHMVWLNYNSLATQTWLDCLTAQGSYILTKTVK